MVVVVVVQVIAEAEQGRYKMKNIIYKIFAVSLILFGLQGCYTILWTPDTKITEEYETTSYYYGYAPDFYDIPWWVSVPVIVGYPSSYSPDGSQTISKDRNNSLENDSRNIRNNDGGRNTEIINTPPPTVSAPDPNPPSSGSDSNNNSGSTVRTESSKSGSSNSGNTRSSDTRSNTGSRNSNSGRR